MKKTNRISTVISLVVILMMTLSALVLPVAAAAPTTSTANITINNVTPTDEFKAYKIIDVTYNSTTNTLSYAWTAGVQAILDANSDTRTAADFNALSVGNADAAQEFLAVIAKDVVALTEAGSATATSESKATFTGFSWGEYLIVPTKTTSVYEIMLAPIQPTATNGVWNTVSNTEINAKKSEIDIKKTVGADKTVGSWSVITYTVEFDVPTYDGTVQDKTLVFKDTADTTLSYKNDVIVIKGFDGVSDTTLDVSTVTKTANNVVPADGDAGFTLKLDFNYDEVKSYKKIKVIYKATINDTAVINTDIKNNAKITYSTYPYITGTTAQKDATATETIKTFGIKIFKYAYGTETGTSFTEITGSATALPGAKFNVYRDVEAGETKDATITVSGASKDVILVASIETDAAGFATVDKVKNSTYYLVETAAPAGYNLSATPIEVTVSAATVDAAGYANKAISNSDGINLPQTGGIGTMIFTVLGIALMAGAVIILVVVNKKKKTQNNAQIVKKYGGQ